jgi:Holliday junction resolvase RusA-like endonuclease
VPVPKGSAKAFVVKGRAIVTQDNREKQKPWASDISYTAAQLTGNTKPSPEGIAITMQFYMPRPKSHLRVNGELTSRAPIHHISKPDLDKLVRCVLDALTGVVWNDDSQVVKIDAYKGYESPIIGTGVKIRISEHRSE